MAIVNERAMRRMRSISFSDCYRSGLALDDIYGIFNIASHRPTDGSVVVANTLPGATTNSIPWQNDEHTHSIRLRRIGEYKISTFARMLLKIVRCRVVVVAVDQIEQL